MAYRPPFIDPAFKMVEAPHPATIDEELLLKSCEISTGRVSGPGGQHRNKVDSAVFIVHLPTGIEAQATERRSQRENKHVAVRRLRRKLASHVRTLASRDTHVLAASAKPPSVRTMPPSLPMNAWSGLLGLSTIAWMSG